MAENVAYANDEVAVVDKKEQEYEEAYGIPETEGVQDDCPAAFAGMPKEVLLHHSRHRGYVWARDILTALVVLTILIMFSLVIAVVVISPSCLEFWQTSPIYEIYPKSFRRSNDESGYGNIKGIAEKIGYMSDLGVKVVSVNSMYQTSQVKSDYEITDFRNIEPTFGTMADMENLIVSIHDEGMKIIVDFVPNHSSAEHPWFLASSNTSHPDYSKYKDYYVWVDGDSSSDLPNNWMSKNEMSSAWTWNEDRQQFYYHAFSSSQPDFNLRNAAVRKELQDILRFWLEKGVDGFRAIATSYMLEAPHLRDNPKINASEELSNRNLYPDFTKHYKGNHDIVIEWRKILDEFSTEPGVYRFLEIHDEGNTETIARYYGKDDTNEASFPLNNLLLRASSDEWTAQNMADRILEWMRIIPKGKWPSWTIGDQDYSRVADRIGKERSLLGMVLTMTLPGTPTIYYGDELGMADRGDTAPDSYRSIMLWNTEDNNGFCGNCTPWTKELFVNSSKETVQKQVEDDDSMLSICKRFISLRNELVFQRGYLCMIGDVGGVLGFVRELRGVRSAIVLLNFENQTTNLDLTIAHETITGHGYIDAKVGLDHSVQVGDRVDLSSVNIPPFSGLVISFDAGESLLSKSDSMTGKCFVHSDLCYNSGLQVLQYC